MAQFIIGINTEPEAPTAGKITIYPKVGGGLFYKRENNTEVRLLTTEDQSDVVKPLTGHVTTNGTTNNTIITPGIIVNAMISNTAGIALSKLAENPLNRSLHTGVQSVSTLSDFTTSVNNLITAALPAPIELPDTILPGDGITLNNINNSFNIVGTANRISVSADAIDIAPSYVGQTSIVTVGSVTTGSWNAATLEIGYGGTNATTAGQAATNLRSVSTFTQDTTLTNENNYIIVDSSGGEVILTIPLASTLPNTKYVVLKNTSDVNNVIIRCTGADTINGNADTVLTTLGQSTTIISNGSTWVKFA